MKPGVDALVSYNFAGEMRPAALGDKMQQPSWLSGGFLAFFLFFVPYSSVAQTWTKLDSGGAELPDSAGQWACVRNDESGHIWEVKSRTESHLRYFNHWYAWHEPQSDHGGDEGNPALSDQCGGTVPGCSSKSYREAVNTQELCGQDNWRLPAIEELETLIEGSRPAINTSLFSEGITGNPPPTFWSVTTDLDSPSRAWYVDFWNGSSDTTRKSSLNHIRLVADGEADPPDNPPDEPPPGSVSGDPENLAGVWYDPASDGDGFYIAMTENPSGSTQLTAYYYGYTSAGSKQWLISDTVIVNDAGQVPNLTMYKFTGKGFAGATNVSSSEWGNLTIQYQGCERATFRLQGDAGQDKTWDGRLLAGIAGTGCGSSGNARQFATISGVSGLWFDSNLPGDGFNFLVNENGLTAFFFGYKPNGKQTWFITNPYQGPILPTRTISMDVLEGRNGTFRDLRNISYRDWGELDITWTSCSEAEIRLSGLDGTKSTTLTQIATPLDTRCADPGTLIADRRSVTFTESGAQRTLGLTARFAGGRQASAPEFKVEFTKPGMVKLAATSDQGITLESRHDRIVTGNVRIWDPVTNSLLSLPVSNVRLQPGAKYIDPADVISSDEPDPDSSYQVTLRNTAATRRISNGDIIGNTDGLIGQVESTTARKATGEIILRLVFTPVTSFLSDVLCGESNTSSSKHLTFNPGREKLFLRPTCQASAGTLDLSQVDTDFNVYAGEVDASFSCRIVNGSVELGELQVSIPVRGRASINTPKITAGAEFSCETGVRIPIPLVELLIARLAPKFDATVGFNFQWPNASTRVSASTDFGALLQYSADFRTGELDLDVEGALPGGDYIRLDGSDSNRIDRSWTFEPFLKGTLGGELNLLGVGRQSLATLELDVAEVTASFPWKYGFVGNPDIGHPDYRGPQQSVDFNFGANVLAKVTGSLFYDWLNLTLVEFDLFDFSSLEIPLYESPTIEFANLSCSSNCAAGEPITGTMKIKRQGPFVDEITGRGMIYHSLNGSLNQSPSFGFSGNTPGNFTVAFTPDEAGTYTIMPRFSLSNDGAIYGAPPYSVDVTEVEPVNKIFVNLAIDGNGSVSFSPSTEECESSDCIRSLPFGEFITLTPEPDSGHRFLGWYGSFNHEQCTAVDNSCRIQTDELEVTRQNGNTDILIGAVFRPNDWVSPTPVINEITPLNGNHYVFELFYPNVPIDSNDDWIEINNYEAELELPNGSISSILFTRNIIRRGSAFSIRAFEPDVLEGKDELSGSMALFNAEGQALDFVRWGNSSVGAPSGTQWSGSLPGFTRTQFQPLGRFPNAVDTDTADDWCFLNPQIITLGSNNEHNDNECVGR